MNVHMTALISVSVHQSSARCSTARQQQARLMIQLLMDQRHLLHQSLCTMLEHLEGMSTQTLGATLMPEASEKLQWQK